MWVKRYPFSWVLVIEDKDSSYILGLRAHDCRADVASGALEDRKLLTDPAVWRLFTGRGNITSGCLS